MKEYSRQPRKQRLANYNRSMQGRMRAMSAHLSDELLKEYSTVRAVVVRKGDTVKVVRGSIKGHVAKVIEVFPKWGMITLEGEEGTILKADGKRVARMFRPSKVIITKLDLSDPWRREKLQKAKEGAKAEKKERKRKPKKEKKEAPKEEASEEKKVEKPAPPEVKKEEKAAAKEEKKEGKEHAAPTPEHKPAEKKDETPAPKEEKKEHAAHAAPKPEHKPADKKEGAK
jgi:large subunit ribosomal protein L24